MRSCKAEQREEICFPGISLMSLCASSSSRGAAEVGNNVDTMVLATVSRCP